MYLIISVHKDGCKIPDIERITSVDSDHVFAMCQADGEVLNIHCLIHDQNKTTK